MSKDLGSTIQTSVELPPALSPVMESLSQLPGPISPSAVCTQKYSSLPPPATLLAGYRESLPVRKADIAWNDCTET